ncbi:MAG TPA: Crp/Fnr family transcriptional regulator [Gemmatimonadaceae bacterium]|nr:Crp/Fnr family transcriptional regulator [Gemmatimonadaceae bacterium]
MADQQQDGLLDALNPRGRSALLEQSVERRFASGAVLWSAGDPSEGIALVLAGKVRIVRGSRGRQTVIHSGGPGATLGEVPFFTGAPYPATAIAAEPTRCLFLTRAAVTQAMSADPAIALFFLKRLSERVQSLVEKVDQNTAHTVQSRLADFILQRSKVVGASASRSRSGRTGAFSLSMTQSALAEELGTVREVIVRSLRSLREIGAIESAGAGKYRVSDVVLLQQLANPSA